MLLATVEAYSDQKLIFMLGALTFFAIPIRYPDPETRIQKEFQNFITIYNRTYHGNETEYKKRYEIFKDTFEMAEDYRQNNRPVFGINRYADMSSNEFRQMYLQAGSARPKRHIVASRPKYENNGLENFGKGPAALPLRVDWRERGIITPIRNQEIRGSGYAHAVLGSIEAMHALKLNSPAHELNVQQMIDCPANTTSACKNGDPCYLLNWLKTENITIHPVAEGYEAARVTDYTCSSFVRHEYEMLAYLAFKGPLIATVNALPWKNYVSGVIKTDCTGPPNHAVQIVGYNLNDEEPPHFIVRNSWGLDFGDRGYVKIAIGGNVCSIAEEVSSVAVD